MPSRLLIEAPSKRKDGAWARTNRSQRLKLALVTRCVTHSLGSQKLLQKEDPWTVPARSVEALGVLKPASVRFGCWFFF